MHERLHRLCIVLTYEGWTAMEACLLYIFASNIVYRFMNSFQLPINLINFRING